MCVWRASLRNGDISVLPQYLVSVINDVDCKVAAFFGGMVTPFPSQLACTLPFAPVLLTSDFCEKLLPQNIRFMNKKNNKECICIYTYVLKRAR